MRLTRKTIVDFYEELYKNDVKVNPAYRIYDRLRVQELKKFLNNNEMVMLIVGCGNRNDLGLMKERAKTVALDLSFQAIRKIIDNRNVINADALALPFESKTFDTLICSEVLEHIPDVNNAILEFHRVLKKDGILILSTPNWWSMFGLIRWVGELFTSRTISSDNQPYDDWKTIIKLKKELSPYFSIKRIKGVWFLPPLHYRGKGLSKKATNFLYFLFSPLEKLLSRLFPIFGHLIILKCSRNSAEFN